MTTFGLVSHYRRWVLSVVTACAFSALAQTATAAQPVITQTVTDASALSRLSAIANTALSTLDGVNYYTAKEFSLPVPGTNQKVTFRWGFGGSGDPFSGFPKIETSLEQVAASEQKTANNFSFVELSKLLLQEKLLKQDNNIALLSWLCNHSISGHKLFFIKLFLLVKDFHTREQLPQFKTELFRLLTKLCLTEHNGLIDTTKPLSAHLPTAINDAIKALCPDVLDTIDAVWSAIVSNGSTNATADMRSTTSRAVYAYAFKDNDQAEAFYNQFNNYQSDSESFKKEAAAYLAQHSLTDTAWTDFVRFTKTATTQSGLQQQLEQLAKTNPMWRKLNPTAAMVSVHEFPLTTPLQYIPTELTTALKAVTVVPAIVRVQVASGDIWVAHVTNQIGATQSVTLATQALIRTLKAYINARKEFFAKNPEAAKAYQAAWEKRETENRRVQKFLATEEDGKASIQQLNQALTALEQGTTVTAPANTAEAQIAQANSDLAAKRAALAKLQTSLNTWKQLTASGTVHDDAELAKREQAVVDMQRTVQAIEQNVQKQAAQPATGDHNGSFKDQLETLVTAANDLRKNGEPVPTELTDEINKLSAQINVPVQAVISQQVSLEQVLAQRSRIADIYQAEATRITKQLAQRQVAINTKCNKRESMLFNIRQRPGYEAYAQYLNTQAQQLRDENTKVHELIDLRNIVKTMQADEIDEKTATRLATLESEVGYLTTPQSPIAGMLRSFAANPELKELVTDLSGNPAYATIKEQLVQDLALIVKKSPYVASNATVIRYLLQTQAPELLPLFDQFVREPQKAAFFGA